MRIIIDIPSDLESKLIEKCDKVGVSPSEFVYSLLEWYFYRRKDKVNRSELNEFLETAKKCGMERVKYCKYSDGSYCAVEVFDDLFAEKEPELISPYKCLFCPYFVDRRKDKKKVEFKELSEAKMYELAKLAAKFVVKVYGDKLGYKPKFVVDESIDEKDVEPRAISKKGVKKLLENW
ncbi:hypothetical protein DRP05_02645 [Archaeoglobales archaeon]|nr:MAG: hypothetical protein DRP05_02645 [Archaeoglobales archaeon]